ncbi:MAG: hypothetical protein RR614_10300, partial [Eubacterium sp.]
MVPSTESRKDGVVTLTIDGKTTAGELFGILDEAVMIIGDHATNCGDLAVSFEIEDTIATVTSILNTSSLTNNRDGTSTLAGNYTATFDVSDGTLAALKTEDIVLTNLFPDEYTVSAPVAEDHCFSFDISTAIETEDGITAADYENELEAMPYLLDVTILNDKLTAANGAPLMQTTFDIMPAENLEAFNGLSNARSTESDAFKYASFAINTVSKLSKGNFLEAFADLLGLGSSSGGDEAILAAIEELNKQNISLQSSVESISTQMIHLENKLEASQNISKYYDTFESLSKTVNAVDNTKEGSLLVKLAKKEKGSKEYTDCAKDITRIIDERSGFQKFLDSTEDLGNMILGQGKVSTSVFE